MSMTSVMSEGDVRAYISGLDVFTERMRKLIKDQGKASEILVPTIHLHEYLSMLDRLRFLERHISNLVLTAKAHGTAYAE